MGNAGLFLLGFGAQVVVVIAAAWLYRTTCRARGAHSVEPSVTKALMPAPPPSPSARPARGKPSAAKRIAGLRRAAL